MLPSVEQMIAPYEVRNAQDRKNAMKEVMQEIVLCGLSRAGFFNEAAFYGGTALRIFYGLDRFSEDLDFSLLAPSQDFSLESFFPVLEREVESFGLKVDIEEKKKTEDSPIRSAFLKGNTREHLLMFYPELNTLSDAASSERVKIKFEVDVNPPEYAGYQTKYRLLPAPYTVKLYDEPSLFAGKIHAVLCRGWSSRVKGRDLYDYVFYLSRGTQVNICHLNARLLQLGQLADIAPLDENSLREVLCDKFRSIHFEDAKKDVLPFIHDSASLELWSADFFCQITENLKTC